MNVENHDHHESATADVPPDGGYGWVCVLAQFLVNAFSWGVAASYSVYLAHYLSHGLFPQARALDYALIGGLNFAVALLISPLAGVLVHQYGVRAPMLAGAAVLPVGLLAASFAAEVWHLYLTQGVAVGIGIGLLYLPAAAAVPPWFSARRSLATGLAAAGTGVGGLAICFMTAALLEAVGPPTTMRITAAVVGVVNLAAALLVRARKQEGDPSHWRIFPRGRLLASYEARLLLAWSVVVMFGYITLMFSLADYAVSIGSSGQDSATVAALLNLGAAVGRPILGYVSDRLGRVPVAFVLTLSCGVLIFTLWLPSTSCGALVAFAIFVGALSGIFWTVIAPLAAEIIGLQELSAFLNIVWLSVALPSLFAEVLQLDITDGSGYAVPHCLAAERNYINVAAVLKDYGAILSPGAITQTGSLQQNDAVHWLLFQDVTSEPIEKPDRFAWDSFWKTTSRVLHTLHFEFVVRLLQHILLHEARPAVKFEDDSPPDLAAWYSVAEVRAHDLARMWSYCTDFRCWWHLPEHAEAMESWGHLFETSDRARLSRVAISYSKDGWIQKELAESEEGSQADTDSDETYVDTEDKSISDSTEEAEDTPEPSFRSPELHALWESITSDEEGRRHLSRYPMVKALCCALQLSGYRAEMDSDGDIWYEIDDGDPYYDCVDRPPEPCGWRGVNVRCEICADPRRYGLGYVLDEAERGLQEAREARIKLGKEIPGDRC